MSTTLRLNHAHIKEVVCKELKQIAPEANLNTVSLDANIREALDIDSFDHLNFLIALHEILGVEIPETDYGELDTLNHIIEYLAARVR
jgi:acyl carrier protein